MGVFNALVFDGINSLNYGVYITGEAVFNSPQRAVEAVTVPGRNGDVLLDLGRYENIEVTYHAGVFGVDQSEFATKIRTFRNLLASRVGYKRITDTYNPNEYRMGTFVAPIDVTPASMDRHGEFDIVFNCKPQRFLTSGETAITVTDGGTVTNPTLFESQPLLEIEGYGTIEFNGQTIILDSFDLGNVVLLDGATYTSAERNRSLNVERQYNYALVNDGDSISLGQVQCSIIESMNTQISIGSPTVDPSSEIVPASVSAEVINGTSIKVTIRYNPISTVVGTRSSYSVRVNIPYTFGSITDTAIFFSRVLLTASDGNPPYSLIFNVGRSWSDARLNNYTVGAEVIAPALTAYSTKPLITEDPIYVDCDFGEAYKIENEEFVSLNEYIDLGSDLPTLASGNNTFALDDTITELKVTPRWWIL